jgi:hypothetical protein
MVRTLAILVVLGAAMAKAAETPSIVLTSNGTAVTVGFLGRQRTLIQCDAPAYYVWGPSTLSVSSATGIKIDTDEKIDTAAGTEYRYLSVISDSGTANCKVFLVGFVQ